MATEYESADWDPMVLHYRDQFCRICLNHFKDGSLCPVDSPIQDTILIEMFIQLTAFEAEDSIVIPKVICLQCKQKLEQAFNIRQKFIAQTEFLIRLAAENKLISYFNEFLFEPDDSNEEKVVDEAVGDETECNDHSSYTKVPNQYYDLTNSEDPGTEQSKAEARAAYKRQRMQALKEKAEATRARKKQRLLAAYEKKRKEQDVLKSFVATTCYICDKKHDSIMERDFHMKEHIPMLPYECNECNSTAICEEATAENGEKEKLIILKTTTQLNRHFMMHRMPHKCEQCYRRFTTHLKLKTHEWSSHGQAKDGLTCEYCGKQFFQRKQFNVHVHHHRCMLSGVFKCAVCNRAFGSNSLLVRHEITHTGVKKYKCMYCDQTFTRSCNRLTHQRTHTGELVHKCPDCDRAFVDSCRLKLHQKTHRLSYLPKRRMQRHSFKVDESGKKHYICQHEGCSFTTTIGQKMSNHKANHIRAFKCDECGKRFATANRVKKHKASMHSGKEKKRNIRTARDSGSTAVKSNLNEVNDSEWYEKEEDLSYIL